MGHKIIVCYLRAGSAVLDDHILNRAAAFMAPPNTQSSDHLPPVIHVELFFPDTADPNRGLSAGIHYGGSVFMHPKSFRRNDWVFHSIPATASQVRIAKAFCERQRGAGFNYFGFFGPSMCNIGNNYRVRNLDTKRMPWFCSELVAYTLLHAGILDNGETREASVHPNAAYNIIQTCCDTFVDSARNLTGRSLQL